MGTTVPLPDPQVPWVRPAIQVGACGDKHGEAGGAKSPGEGKVHSAEGGRNREGDEGGVGDARA